MKQRKSSTVTNVITKSEARRQEKLAPKEARINAIDIGEQRKSRSKGKRG